MFAVRTPNTRNKVTVLSVDVAHTHINLYLSHTQTVSAYLAEQPFAQTTPAGLLFITNEQLQHE